MNKFYFKGEISWILIPIFIYLYVFVKKSRSILFYPFLLVAILGIWNLILVKKDIFRYKYGLIQFIFVFIFHFILLLPILQYKKYSNPNFYSLLLILLGILILKFLPWWPYEGFKRNQMILNILILYLFLNLIFYMLRLINFTTNKF